VTAIRVLVATAADLPDAQALVFEYMASTQHEAGRHVPASIDRLPGVLRAECTDLAAAYRSPGGLLVAYQHRVPIGCVGLKPVPPAGTAEVKRLYIRPTHRRGGAARLLMHHAHRFAARRDLARLVLDVMPTRTHVVDFYRQLGYVDAEPSGPMVHLQRPVGDPVEG